ncbi:protein kinase [Spirillospora sp. NPDC052242]
MADRYRLESPIGRGGMGRVWRATDLRLDRPVAVKVLADGAADPALVARFRREAHLAAGLQHPGITVVHDIDQDADTLFLVMELLNGEDLRAVLARHPAGLPPARPDPKGAQACKPEPAECTIYESRTGESRGRGGGAPTSGVWGSPPRKTPRAMAQMLASSKPHRLEVGDTGIEPVTSTVSR